MKTKDDSPLVEVFVGTLWEAELVKGLLETEKIQSALKSDGLASIIPSVSVNFCSNGTSVLVNAEDYQVAMQLIESREDKGKSKEEK